MLVDQGKQFFAGFAFANELYGLSARILDNFLGMMIKNVLRGYMSLLLHKVAHAEPVLKLFFLFHIDNVQQRNPPPGVLCPVTGVANGSAELLRIIHYDEEYASTLMTHDIVPMCCCGIHGVPVLAALFIKA